MALPKQVLRYNRKLTAMDYELFQSDFLATISSEPLTAEFLNYSHNIHTLICKIAIISRPKSHWFNSTLSSMNDHIVMRKRNIMQTISL